MPKAKKKTHYSEDVHLESSDDEVDSHYDSEVEDLLDRDFDPLLDRFVQLECISRLMYSVLFFTFSRFITMITHLRCCRPSNLRFVVK